MSAPTLFVPTALASALGIVQLLGKTGIVRCKDCDFSLNIQTFLNFYIETLKMAKP